MSSKEGPRVVGIRTSANDHVTPTWRASTCEGAGRGVVMSSKQGPHAVGVCPSANDHLLRLGELESVIAPREVQS